MCLNSAHPSQGQQVGEGTKASQAARKVSLLSRLTILIPAFPILTPVPVSSLPDRKAWPPSARGGKGQESRSVWSAPYPGAFDGAHGRASADCITTIRIVRSLDIFLPPIFLPLVLAAGFRVSSFGFRPLPAQPMPGVDSPDANTAPDRHANGEAGGRDSCKSLHAWRDLRERRGLAETATGRVAGYLFDAARVDSNCTNSC